MNKKTIGILAVIAIVVIILVAAGLKKESPAPEELTGEERTEAAAKPETSNERPAADTAAAATDTIAGQESL